MECSRNFEAEYLQDLASEFLQSRDLLVEPHDRPRSRVGETATGKGEGMTCRAAFSALLFVVVVVGCSEGPKVPSAPKRPTTTSIATTTTTLDALTRYDVVLACGLDVEFAFADFLSGRSSPIKESALTALALAGAPPAAVRDARYVDNRNFAGAVTLLHEWCDRSGYGRTIPRPSQ